jgi:hypothetical protein
MASIVSAGTTSATALNMSADTSGVLQLASNNGTVALTISTAQNIGIGTSSPAVPLQVNSGASVYSDQLRVRNTNFGNADIGVGSGIMALATDMSNMVFYTNSSLGTTGSALPTNERMRITSSGDVVIGATSAIFNARFGVKSSNNALAAFVGNDAAGTAYFVNTNGSGQVNHYATYETSGVNCYHAWWTTTSGGSQTQAMTLDVSGNLLVGTTTVTTAKLNVVNGGFAISGETTAGANSSIVFFSKRTAVGIHIRFDQSGTVCGDITTSGSTTTYGTSSDYRLKNTIAPMTGALAKVALLKPCTYKWNLDDSESQGFIAHELQAVVPECVTGTKDAVETYTDEDGNEQTRPAYQGIDTSFLVATLTAAIQELNAKVTSLEEQVLNLGVK